MRLHLANINGWTAAVTDAYLAWCFEVHALRSEYEWTSDWSLFARTYGDGVGVLPTQRACMRCLWRSRRGSSTRTLCQSCS